MIHVVKAGETPASIAGYYGVSISRLLFDNQIREAGNLAVGQALLVLLPETIHSVRTSETLEEIAGQYGVTVLELVRNNPFLLENNMLLAGENLVIRYK